ncbi:hypothetical protein A2U01_0105001, partial [Trifolium medium]|nr:hypothetical protein [Trifolium medium]
MLQHKTNKLKASNGMNDLPVPNLLVFIQPFFTQLGVEDPELSDSIIEAEGSRFDHGRLVLVNLAD